MSTRLTGAEVKQWYALPWDDHCWIDEDVWKVNGREVDGGEFKPEDLSDDADVECLCGTIVSSRREEDSRSLVRELKKWKASLTHLTLVVQIDKSAEEEFRKLLSLLPGGKVVSG